MSSRYIAFYVKELIANEVVTGSLSYLRDLRNAVKRGIHLFLNDGYWNEILFGRSGVSLLKILNRITTWLIMGAIKITNFTKFKRVYTNWVFFLKYVTTIVCIVNIHIYGHSFCFSKLSVRTGLSEVNWENLISGYGKWRHVAKQRLPLVILEPN